MSDMIKCDKCGKVLVNSSGSIFFGKGVTLRCRECGNKMTIDDPITVKGKKDDPTINE